MYFLLRAGIVLFGFLYVSTNLLGGNGTATRRQLLGGWTKQNVSSDPKYLKLAHMVISNQTKHLEHYYTVVELTEVETQVVAGVNYKLTFNTSESTCKTDKEYTKECCLPKPNTTVHVCTAVVYEIPWLNQTSTTRFECQPPISTPTKC